MQIEIKLDENCKEPKIIVVTNKMTDEINEIMKRLSDEQPKMDCTPFVRQYDILSKKWGVLLCQKEYQTNDIRRNSRSW